MNAGRCECQEHYLQFRQRELERQHHLYLREYREPRESHHRRHGRDDHIDLAPAISGSYSVSANTFATITFNDPGYDGSLTINGGAGNDTINTTAIVNFAPGLTLDGGEGDNDTLALGTGHYSTLTYGMTSENVIGTPVQNNFVLDVRPSIGNRIHVYRPAAGQLTFDEDSGLLTHKIITILDPLVSLTIDTGYNAPGTEEYIHFGQTPGGTTSPIGMLNVDVKLRGGSLHSDDGDDSIDIFGNLDLNGHVLNLQAETITIHDGATVSTSNPSGQASNITLYGDTSASKPMPSCWPRDRR